MTDIEIEPRGGTLIAGRYRLVERIGRGGSADVFRAQDTRIPREVAVKVLRDRRSDGETLRRLRSEVTLLAALTHPSLVTLHDAGFGDDGDDPYIVMELVDGADLARTAGSLPIEELVSVVADVAAALAHAHFRGVVHRDVKPGNVLVRHVDGTPRGTLADLGIAYLMDATRATAGGSIVGTVAYLSPEQARGDRVTTASDVYSLGLLLIEALTGARAFPGTEAESMAARLVRGPALPAGLSAADEALLRAMTATDPADRPDAATVRTALRSWTSPRPTAAVVGARTTAAADTTADDPVATAAAEAPTRRLAGVGLAPPSTVDTDAADDTEIGQPESRTGRSRRPSRRTLLLGGAVAVLLVAAGLVIPALSTPAPAAPTTPAISYPAIDGELGESFERLESVIEP
ncbi:serine/threonine-protein kinase [Herbiconiux sp. L3-i23]|uniref:serine/threonine-protein kinase n=1 Tax=Herbiconiux sp. L3-i23 TaxID=2905871 RepID=UPI002048B983|nr:serine/threonine-protein kinase [Herbiconiux sp. L3-i23]BDI22048.1 hypothetical protein L3i23_08240 [Herbiconiux sp. L3-i23]